MFNGKRDIIDLVMYMKRVYLSLAWVVLALFFVSCGVQTVNLRPTVPSNPKPSNNQTGVSVNTTLSWICSDLDGDTLVYDVYFGTDANPPLVKSNHATTTYSPGTLSYGTTYYWKIVAKDDKGGQTSGPIWSFTTMGFSGRIRGKISPYEGDVTRASVSSNKQLDFSKKISEEYVPGEYIVQFDLARTSKSKESLMSSLKTFGSSKDQLQIGEKIFYLLKSDLDLNYMKQNLSRLPDFVNIEPNYVFTISGTIPPNDSYYSQQWNLQMTNLHLAWFETQSAEFITIAVVDSGIDLNHEDLQGVILTGYDFVENDQIPQDEHGHGTHVTGIISALTNNGKGVASVTWGLTKIIPLRVFDAQGEGTSFNVAKAFVYAVDHGAKLINFSGGAKQGNDAMYQAVKYAYENDVIIVCAAGNDGTMGIDYPAAYSETIAVGAVNYYGERASYSDYGPELDFVAPGGEEDLGVLSTWRNNMYLWACGTSMAAPHVTGVIALMIAKGITGVQNIREILGRTAYDLGPMGWDQYYGWGLIDAYAAVTWQGGWKPLVVFTTNDQFQLDNWTEADSQGNYEIEVRSQRVYLFAWMDFDSDDKISAGDLYGYYGYTSGKPLDGQVSLIELNYGQTRQLNFDIAPIIDITDRPQLSAIDQEGLRIFKEKVIEEHYERLRKK